MSIGSRIKSRREELGMSQEELANKIGYKSKSSINKIELDVQQLRQVKIKQIADALETTTDYIMGWQPTSNYLIEYWEKLQALSSENQIKVLERIDTLAELENQKEPSQKEDSL